MEKKKILILSASPAMHTGFGKVIREIWKALHATGKYEIHCIGLWHPKQGEKVPFPIYVTNQDLKGDYTQEDLFAQESFSKYIEQIKPELVWTCANITMIYYIQELQCRNLFKWIGYFPIDGEPMPTNWGRVIENMDRAVAYGKYGIKVIQEKFPKTNLSYIYHGVNPEVFRPLSDKEKIEIKKEMGVDPSKTIIGVVARNEGRKAFDKIFEAFSYLVSGDYIHCNMCQKIAVYPHDILGDFFSPLSSCPYCKSLDCKKGSPREDLRLYIHAAVVDFGWNLFDLQRDYHLKGKVYFNPELKIGEGVSEEKLNKVYNIFDIFTLPTRGEGFGLPILEAMSAGVPIVVTDYSAHPEWAKECGELVPPITLEAEPITNIRRAVINMDEYVGALLKLIEDPKLRKKYGAKGREVALKMDWKEICKEWENLVDETLLLKDSL